MSEEGPDWGPTLEAINRPAGANKTKSKRLGFEQVEEWQKLQQQRTGADVAVALGGIDTGDDYDGWGHVLEWGNGVIDRFKAWINGWTGGSSSTGDVAEVIYVMEDIKDTIINGYTVSTFTSDTAAWPVPPHVEMTAILISGGQNGSAVSAGVGGLHGSFFVTPIDLTGITALDIQIGTAGNLTYVREAAGTAHTGAVVVQSKEHGSAGGSAINSGLFGLTPTNSLPGSGGNGGGGGPGGTIATPGGASSLASGGAAGSAGNFGTGGSPGGSVSAGSQVKCGGGGGGGGGRANVPLNGGGNGGAGGYPGGGGGGRGQGWGGGSNGANGPGAPGVCWLVYK